MGSSPTIGTMFMIFRMGLFALAMMDVVLIKLYGDEINLGPCMILVALFGVALNRAMAGIEDM